MNMLKTVLSTILFALFYISCTTEKTVPQQNPPDEVVVKEKKEYEIDNSKIIWGDEFEGNGALNSEKWGFDIGGSGWGNNESQFYTQRPENARVQDGNLVIEAKRESYQGSQYTSARVVSKEKGDFKYGRFEIKAKLPVGVGTWPAIWMLATKTTYGSQYWPDNGEIDIMEHVGFDQNVVHGNVHTKAFNHSIGTNKGSKTTVKGASEEFHVYAINWLPEKITFEIDGVAYFAFPKENGFNWQQWPFDQDFHLLMNIAVGGAWGGQQGIDSKVFPQQMLVDYVRVYGIKEK
jgi:beta-glucanase (GH16 family)